VQNELSKFQADSELDRKVRDQHLEGQKKAVADAQRIRKRREDREKKRKEIAQEVAGDLGRTEEERLQKMCVGGSDMMKCTNRPWYLFTCTSTFHPYALTCAGLWQSSYTVIYCRQSWKNMKTPLDPFKKDFKRWF
jgi:hypothetical protein